MLQGKPAAFLEAKWMLGRVHQEGARSERKAPARRQVMARAGWGGRWGGVGALESVEILSPERADRLDLGK